MWWFDKTFLQPMFEILHQKNIFDWNKINTKYFENESTKLFYVLPFSNGSDFVISQFHVIVIWTQREREREGEEEIEKFHLGEQLQWNIVFANQNSMKSSR